MNHQPPSDRTLAPGGPPIFNPHFQCGMCHATITLPNYAKRTQFQPQRSCGRPKNAKRTQFQHTKCPTTPIFYETNPIYLPRPDRLCETNPIYTATDPWKTKKYETNPIPPGQQPIANHQPQKAKICETNPIYPPPRTSSQWVAAFCAAKGWFPQPSNTQNKPNYRIAGVSLAFPHPKNAKRTQSPLVSTPLHYPSNIGKRAGISRIRGSGYQRRHLLYPFIFAQDRLFRSQNLRNLRMKSFWLRLCRSISSVVLIWFNSEKLVACYRKQLVFHSPSTFCPSFFAQRIVAVYLGLFVASSS